MGAAIDRDIFSHQLFDLILSATDTSLTQIFPLDYLDNTLRWAYNVVSEAAMLYFNAVSI